MQPSGCRPPSLPTVVQQRILRPHCLAVRHETLQFQRHNLAHFLLLYPAEVAGADLSRWNVLGMEHNSAQDVWDKLKAVGHPTIVHIFYSAAQTQTGLECGARGLMAIVPNVVRP